MSRRLLGTSTPTGYLRFVQAAVLRRRAAYLDRGARLLVAFERGPLSVRYRCVAVPNIRGTVHRADDALAGPQELKTARSRTGANTVRAMQQPIQGCGAAVNSPPPDETLLKIERPARKIRLESRQEPMCSNVLDAFRSAGFDRRLSTLDEFVFSRRYERV